MSKAVTIAETIRERIRTSAYTGKIPGERALADEFSVNFKTANRAISLLVEEGTLLRRRGEGTFVAPVGQRRDLTIGLCFAKHTDPGRDPVFARFFAGMNRAAKGIGARIDVSAQSDLPAGPGDADTRFAEAILAARPDALIYLGNIKIPLMRRLQAACPLIVVAEVPDELGFDTVRRDIRGGIAAAVRHLAAAGHREIALASFPETANAYDHQAKDAGYLDAIAELRLTPRILRRNGGNPADLLKSLRADPACTAVVCLESGHGLGLMTEAQKQGLRVPEDLAVISFDDGDVGAHLHPPMSSLHAFGADLADLAMQRLREILDGTAQRPVRETLPCPLILRP